jgi:hypothetical protein
MQDLHRQLELGKTLKLDWLKMRYPKLILLLPVGPLLAQVVQAMIIIKDLELKGVASHLIMKVLLVWTLGLPIHNPKKEERIRRMVKRLLLRGRGVIHLYTRKCMLTIPNNLILAIP